jgi:DNA helicase HerA-like ATPase
MSIESQLKAIAQVDILKEGAKEGQFVGRPFFLTYDRAHILINDYWKNKVGGVAQGCLLLAFYQNPNDTGTAEVLLLRALAPTKLPTDSDVISSMVEYYKDNLETGGPGTKLDEFTRYEFSFSGLECRVLGTFYKYKGSTDIEFGADVENFYAANNYKVYKATGDVLKYIVNQRAGEEIAGNENEFDLGTVRYSSSRRFDRESEVSVPVYINPKDFLGKRTALFGMTRTGKSNTVKIIIQASTEISAKAPKVLTSKPADENALAEVLDPFTEAGAPKYPVGQLIFDINGEYANPNMQDEGTAIYELYKEQVVRYSVLEKKGFKVMKVNFFNDVLSGFELIASFLGNDTSDYVSSFTSIDLSAPEDPADVSAKTRYERKVACYLSCLYKAGFKPPTGFKVKFKSSADLVAAGMPDISPEKGVVLEDAAAWFERIWAAYDNHAYFTSYPSSHNGKEWADEDLKALMVFLCRKKTSRVAANISGYRKLQNTVIQSLHTTSTEKPFQVEIIDALRKGMIVIVDLSQGDPVVQQLYSERICRQLFADAMNRFVNNIANNFVQFYFEEAHNLFPKKEEKDLSQIYNRIAKEGAKLNLGMVYATQEVSSISANILKNTQNWFIAHLNNEDETRELKKYYDFNDFVDSLVRFSAKNDKGFVRMKTYSNPFVVPVQIKRFTAKKGS